jgi:hypothetical protein
MQGFRGFIMVKKISVAAALAATLLAGASAAQAQSLNPAPMCAVSPTTFSSWQNTSSSSSSTLSFLPPNSATFQVTQGDCSFYQWSSQMFLWLTSTDSSGNMVMFSKSFYNAVEDPTTGNFTFAPNTTTTAAKAANGVAKPKIQILTRVNKPTPAVVETANKLKLKRTATPNALATSETSEATSTGQADSGVLLVTGSPVANPNNSATATYPVVYYSIHVNDVFVGLQNNQATVNYYNNGPNQSNFPITAAQVTDIATAAKTTYADANQLTVEVKNSWVDTAYLSSTQAAGLITVSADVPAFAQSTNSSGNAVLTWDGKTTVTRTLALVGMHVVGTVAGHPEMVWATFESDFNSPDATYSFINNNFQNGTCPTGQNCLSTVTFSTSSSTPSIFYTGTSGASAPPEPIVMTANSGGNNTTITSTSSKLVPTNVARLNPWGNRQPTSPSLTDPVVINNTQLLSLETTLNSALTTAGKNGPILANYKQIGAVWTNGTIPITANNYQPQDVSLAIGSVYLANTTMETFEQSTAANPTGTSNCFTCHSISPNSPAQIPTTAGATISHVFSQTSTPGSSN